MLFFSMGNAAHFNKSFLFYNVDMTKEIFSYLCKQNNKKYVFPIGTLTITIRTLETELKTAPCSTVLYPLDVAGTCTSHIHRLALFSRCGS